MVLRVGRGTEKQSKEEYRHLSQSIAALHADSLSPPTSSLSPSIHHFPPLVTSPHNSSKGPFTTPRPRAPAPDRISPHFTAPHSNLATGSVTSAHAHCAVTTGHRTQPTLCLYTILSHFSSSPDSWTLVDAVFFPTRDSFYRAPARPPRRLVFA